MKMQLNNWQHSAVSYGLLILGIGILYILIVLPFLTKQHGLDERIEDLRFNLNRFNTTAVNIKPLQKEVAELKNKSIPISDFLPGKTHALAAADLQSNIEKLINSNQGNVLSTHTINIDPKRVSSTDASKEKGNDELFQEVTIKVHMRGNINALQKILYQLSANKPMLFIAHLQIQHRHQTTNRKKKEAPNTLEVRFNVSGYILNSNI